MESCSSEGRQYARELGDADGAGDDPGDGVPFDDRGNFLEVVDRRIEDRLTRDAAEQVGDFVDVTDEEQA